MSTCKASVRLSGGKEKLRAIDLSRIKIVDVRFQVDDEVAAVAIDDDDINRSGESSQERARERPG